MRLDRRVDQHGPAAMRLYHVGGIKAAERRADVAHWFVACHAAYQAHGVARRMRQRRAGEFLAEAAFTHESLHELRLVRLRRRVEAVEIDDQAAAALCRRSRSFV